MGSTIHVIIVSLGLVVAFTAAPEASHAEERTERLHELLYRERQQKVLLDRARQKLQAGETTVGLQYIRQILDGPDSFALRGTNPQQLQSVRREAADLLDSLDTNALRTYERLYGAEAERLLNQARQSGEVEQFRQVTRRFFHTSAGFQAADWLAMYWMDRGRYGLAARWWSQLLNSAAHRRRRGANETLLLKTALAEKLSGDAEAAAGRLKRLAGAEVTIAGRTVEPALWLKEATERFTRVSGGRDWPMAAGHRQLTDAQSGTGPYLDPLWKVSHFEKPDAWIGELLAGWTRQQREKLLPLAVANSAIVVDNRVVVRGLDSIRAFDLQTGNLFRRYTCQTSVAKAARAVQSRFGNRPPQSSEIRSLFRIEQAFAENGILGTLSSDGRRIYAIDSLQLLGRGADSRHGRRAEQIRQAVKDASINSLSTNRLVALPLPDAGDEASTNWQPAWSVGGKVESGAESRTLGGHFFLGPPLPVGNRLFAVAEINGQLNLVALKGRTGELMWSQALGYVNEPIRTDASRSSLLCSPAFSRGIVVCPTGAGFLVAVDVRSGTLLWARYYGDPDGRDGHLRLRSRPWDRRDRRYGHPGFANRLHIQNGRVVYLPPYSKSIHCYDLQTGETQWEVPRRNPQPSGNSGNGDEYIGSIIDGTVLVVGREDSRGLSLQTGAEKWSVRLGMPSGRGVQVGGNYLLPLQKGRVVSLEVTTGREVGIPLSPGKRIEPTGASLSREKSDDWIPGNLIAAEETILSAGLGGLTAFPQSGPLLQEVRRKLAEDPNSVETLRQAAELELMLGQLDSAETHLERLFAVASSSRLRGRPEALMRKLLYRRLREGQGEPKAILQRLGGLVRTPNQRGKYLIRLAKVQLQQGDLKGVLRTVGEFAGLDLHTLVPRTEDSTHLVSAGSWVAHMLSRVAERFGQEGRRQIAVHVAGAQQKALTGDDETALQKFLNAYGGWPQADPVRMERVEQLIEQHAFQQAELLLLTTRRSDDRQTAARATWKLARLWNDLGLHQRAARLVDQLESRQRDVSLGDGLTGSQVLEQFSPDSFLRATYRDMQPPDWPIRRVHIHESQELDFHQRLESYSSYRRRYVTPPDNPFQLLLKDTDSSHQRAKLAIVDKQVGVQVGTLEMPFPVRYPRLARDAHVGHFIPIGGRGLLTGVSLLEHGAGKSLWTTEPNKVAQPEKRIRVGPAGPSFCTFQTQKQLIAVDPGTGRILWQRNDIPPGSGLFGDAYSGLIGDERVLVLLSADRTRYTLFRTTTGEKLREGRTQLDPQRKRLFFGRRLFYTTRGTGEKRLRLWDPLDDRLLFDEPIEGRRAYVTTTSHDEIVILLPPNRLLIVDASTGERRLAFRMPLEDIAGLNRIRAFRDGQRYYVNFQRGGGRPQSRKYHYYLSNTFLPVEKIKGDLHAFDRQTGRRLWQRTMPQRSLIRMPHYRLPLLIGLSRVRDRRHRDRKGLLVEVLDARTGETLAAKNNFVPDRIVTMNYDHRQGRLELGGLRSGIHIDFGRGRQWREPDEHPWWRFSNAAGSAGQ